MVTRAPSRRSRRWWPLRCMPASPPSDIVRWNLTTGVRPRAARLPIVDPRSWFDGWPGSAEPLASAVVVELVDDLVRGLGKLALHAALFGDLFQPRVDQTPTRPLGLDDADLAVVVEIVGLELELVRTVVTGRV